MMDYEDDIDPKDMKEALKEALKGAKKSKCATIIWLEAADESVQVTHVGSSSTHDTLRLVKAHQDMAMNLEQAVVEATGMTPAQLKQRYRDIDTDGYEVPIHDQLVVQRKGHNERLR